MLAFTTLKSFFLFKVFEDFDLHLALTRIRKMIYTIYFFVSPLFLKRTLGSRSFHPFTSFRINSRSSLLFLSVLAFLLAFKFSLSLSLSLSSSHSFLLDIWYKRILRLENCLSTRRYRRSVQILWIYHRKTVLIIFPSFFFFFIYLTRAYRFLYIHVF